MKKEYNSLVENNVWELVDIQEIKPIVGLFSALKCGPSGEIVRYKARLVAKGFSQVPGGDFYETYSPTTRLSTIRLLLSYAIRNGSELRLKLHTWMLTMMKRTFCSKLWFLKNTMSNEIH